MGQSCVCKYQNDITELEDETKCDNEYLIDLLKTINRWIEFQKEILDR